MSVTLVPLSLPLARSFSPFMRPRRAGAQSLTNVQKLSLDLSTTVGSHYNISDAFQVSGFGDARDGFYFYDVAHGGTGQSARYIKQLPFLDDGSDYYCRYNGGFWGIGFANDVFHEGDTEEVINPWNSTWTTAGLTLTHPASQQLSAASTAITGQFVKLAGTTEVNAVYTKRGTSGGKDYYNQIGQADDTTTYSIVWGNLGGILGTGWGINGAGAVLDYYSLDAVSRPDQVTTWIAINLDQVPTVTSITQGDLIAGLKRSTVVYTVNGSQNGRSLFHDVLGVAVDIGWDGTKWTDGTNNGSGNTAIPSLAGLGTKDNVAAEGNWIPYTP